MSKNYDNWERLVTTVMRRERDKQLALTHSRDPSTISSISSSFDLSFSSTSQFDDGDESLVRPQARPLPIEYLDLTLDHNEWKILLSPDKKEVLLKSLSLSFFLDQKTGKNCFLLGVPIIQISSEGALNKYSHMKSRFLEVAEIKYTKMIHIQGSIKTQMLSPYTYYGAILVFGSTEDFPVSHKANTSIKILPGEPDDYSRKHDRVVHFQTGIVRADGWMEVEVGYIYVGLGDIIEIQVRLAALNGYTKSGIIIEGIEFRPWGSPPLRKKTQGANEFLKLFDDIR